MFSLDSLAKWIEPGVSGYIWSRLTWRRDVSLVFWQRHSPKVQKQYFKNVPIWKGTRYVWHKKKKCSFQMFFSMVSSQVAPRLQVKEQIKKEWIPESKREVMNIEHLLQASGNLTRKNIGVSLKATKTQIMSIFSDHIFIEIALVVSHGNGLGNKDQGLWQILSLWPSAVLSLTVLLAVLFEHGVTDIRSVCMFTSSWGPKGPVHVWAHAPVCTSANVWRCSSVSDANWWLCSFRLFWLTLNFLRLTLSWSE